MIGLHLPASTGSHLNPTSQAPAAQVDELVAGAAAQLPGAERALCTRRSLYHVLLALEGDRDALMLDGEDVRFCV